jgi:hypothetical protein
LKLDERLPSDAVQLLLQTPLQFLLLTLRFLELLQQLRLLLLDYYLEGEMVHQETSPDSTDHK